MSAAKLLDRLERVRQTGPDRWSARCPAHDDTSPSLTVREVEDGRILIHCFAGCGAAEIMESLGLALADLFEKPLEHFLSPVRRGWTARELLEISRHEITCAWLLTEDATKRSLTAEEQSRLAQAASRLQKAVEFSGGR